MRQLAVVVGDQLRLYDVDDATTELHEVARARVSTADSIHLARLAVGLFDLLAPLSSNGTTPAAAVAAPPRAPRAPREPRRAPEPAPLPTGLGRRQRAIVEALGRLGEANVNELLLVMPGVTRNAVSSCLTDLRRMGFVEKRGHHRWGRTTRTEPLPGTTRSRKAGQA